MVFTNTLMDHGTGVQSEPQLVQEEYSPGEADSRTLDLRCTQKVLPNVRTGSSKNETENYSREPPNLYAIKFGSASISAVCTVGWDCISTKAFRQLNCASRSKELPGDGGSFTVRRKTIPATATHDAKV